jgi:glycosyltransferase involved in cell wall biosynthesis
MQSSSTVVNNRNNHVFNRLNPNSDFDGKINPEMTPFSSLDAPLLSVIMPCYNEASTIPRVIEAVKSIQLEKEIIAVDDCSSDNTLAILQREAERDPRVKVVRHSCNQGKGAAVRTGLQYARGEITIIQDADLEYDPNDYYELVSPIVEKRISVVYGSRFRGPHTGMYFWNAIGNKGLTFLTNFLYNCWISDMETCYKVVPTDILRSLNLESNDFRLEPEITAKLRRRGYHIYEVPISYMGRTYAEGKKMKPIQGVYAVFTLLRYRLWR